MKISLASASERASGKEAGKEQKRRGDERREGREQKLELARVVFKLLPGVWRPIPLILILPRLRQAGLCECKAKLDY